VIITQFHCAYAFKCLQYAYRYLKYEKNSTGNYFMAIMPVNHVW